MIITEDVTQCQGAAENNLNMFATENKKDNVI